MVRPRKIQELIRLLAERVLTEELKPLILDQDEIGDACLLYASDYNDLLEKEGGPNASGPEVEAARRRLRQIEAKLNLEVDVAIKYALAKMHRRSGPCSVAYIHRRAVT